MAQTIADLEIKISSQSSNASDNIDKLAKSLENLKNNAKLTTVKNNLNKLSEGLDKLQSSSSSLKNLDKLSNSLSDLSKNFNKINITKTVQGITNYSSATQKATTSNKNFGTSLAWVATKATLMYQGIVRAFNSLGQFVKLSNDYIENMNIFHISMGGMYDEAFAYAQLVNEKLGIDISEWTRNQAVFASMANGFGLAEEQVYKLSKGLTEVSYDLASLYNADTQTAFTKVRSALAGEIEPLRQWGFALDQNTLQQVANAHGIQMQYSAMTQSQKAMLRYTAIVEQATKMGAIGDMARTLESPANAIRILQQQFVQLGRAIGNVFLPILQQVIPYVQAFTRIITNLISKLAVLVGFTMPTWDNSSWEGTSGAIDEATESAKEYKNATMGFDELNTITPPSSSASGGLGGDLGLNITDVWTEGMLAGITSEVDTLVAKIETLFAKLTQPLEVISFDNLKLALTNLGIALAPFAEKIGEGLWWFYTEVLVPLAEWTIEDALPTFINALATGITNLQVGLDNFGSWVSNNIEPIIGITTVLGTFFGVLALSGSVGAITSALAIVGNALAMVFGVITGNSASMSAFTFMFPKLASAISLVLSPTGLLVGVFALVVGAFAQLYASSETFRSTVNELASNIANTFIAVFQDLWQVLVSCKDLFVGLWKDAILPLWNALVTLLEPVFHALINTINMLWFTVLDPLVQFITGVLSQAWQSIVNIIVEGVLPVFHDIINVITPLIEAILWFVAVLWDTLLVAFTGVFSAVGMVIKGFEEVISLVFKVVENVLVGICGFISSIFKGDWEGAWKAIEGIFTKTWEDIKTFGSNMIDWFVGLGKNIIDGLTNGIKNSIGKVKEVIGEVAEGVTSWFKNILGINSPSKEMADNGYYTVEGVIVGIQNAQNVAKDTIADLGTVLVDTFKGIFNPTVFSDIAKECMSALTKMFNDVALLTSTSMTLTTDVINNAMNTIRNSVSTTASAVGSMVASMVSQIKNAVSSASSSLSQLSSMASQASSLASSISSSVASASNSFSGMQVKAYASGGVVSTGQMFIAREAGAELVGNIGGRTSVMNNDQIVQAVSQGVASAVASVMGGNNNQNITIELDGEVLYRSNQNVSKRLGYNLGI